jgi:O-antigen/teichoic acid export membrane protein
LSAQTAAGIRPIVPVSPARQAGWWAGKAFWAVLDQGLFAISNFALAILLARWLSPEQFGSFAVAHSVFLLAGTLHAGLVREPMLVFGSGRHADRFPRYLDILLGAHWRLAGSASVLLASGALILWVFGLSALASAFLGAAVATPLILFGWLVRQACFSVLQPQWAARGGGLYLLILLAGCYLLWYAQLLSAFTGLAAMGGAGFISGCWVLGHLRRAMVASHSVGAPSRHDVFRDHWGYGRWALASSGLSWIPGNIYFILLPAFGGLESAGALKAVLNLVMPVLHANGALATLLLPALASKVQDKSQFSRLVLAGVTVLGAGSLLYWCFLTTFRYPIVEWFYRGTYIQTASLVPIVALLPLSAACSAVFGSALRALERPQQVFWAYAVSTGATLTVGVWGTAVWGLRGATVGILLSSVITAAACGAFLMCSTTKVKMRRAHLGLLGRHGL